MSALCLAAAKLFAAIPVASFTLAWTTPGDDVRWEQQWRVEKSQLRQLDAQKRESDSAPTPGVGENTVKKRILVATGTGMPRYEICIDGRCRPLVSLLPGLEPDSSIEISACPDETE